MVGPTIVNVELVGEVRAEGMARFFIHAVLEEGAEDFRLHERPVVAVGGFVELIGFAQLELDEIDLFEEVAIEILDAGVASAARRFLGGHLAEKAAEEIEGIRRALGALLEEIGDEVVRQQADVLRDDGDEKLKDVALGAGAVFAARDDLAEDFGEGVGGFAGDLDAVVAEARGFRRGQEEAEGTSGRGEVAQEDAFDGVEELGVEVIDPELVEVAKDGVGRFARDDVGPVFEELVVVFFEVLAARFHLDEHALRPDEIAVLLAALRLCRQLALEEFELRGAGLFRDAKLEGGARGDGAGMAERTEEMIEERLRLALLVAFQRAGEGGELRERGLQFSRGHGYGE